MKKIKINDNVINTIKFLVVVGCICFFSLLPYHNDVMPFGHDLGYHLNRINEISNGLNIKKIPVLIHAGLLDNIGYGNGLFYPQIFLYFPAILISVFKFQLIPAYKVFLFFVTYATFLSMYYSTKTIFKKKEVAFLASLLYVFSLWRIVDIYIRGAVAEVLAFAFFPLVFAGLYNVIYEKDKKWYLITIGLVGIAYSHVLSFLFTCVLILIICVLSVDKIVKDKKVFLRLFIAAFVAFIISIGFFGPMLEQKNNDVYNVDGRTTVSSELLKERALSVRMALSNRFSYGYAEDSMKTQGGMTEGVGTILYLFAGLFFFRKVKYKENRYEIILFILGCIAAVLTTRLIPWEKLTFMNFIQFPFRFNFIIVLFFSFVGANSLYEILDDSSRRNIMILASIVFMMSQIFVISQIDVNFDIAIRNYDDLTQTFDRQVGSAEYLPDGTIIWDLDLYNTNDKETIIPYNQIGSTIEFEYDRDDIDFEFNIPLVYYKGYTASITDKDGNVRELECVEYDNKHVLVKSNERLTGTIKVEYKLTTIQKVSYVISIIGFLGLLIYLVVINFRYTKNGDIKKEK